MRVSIIGVGHRGQKFINAVLENKHLTLNALCDPNKDQVNALAQKHQVKAYYKVEDLLYYDKPDFAIVVVPHDQYLPIIKQLAQHGVHIIKEKPLAISLQEASEISSLLQLCPIKMMVATQRRFDLIYQVFPMLLKEIGKVFCITGEFSLNISRLDEGWRASKSKAGGGALLDMGYHYLDVLLWYFGQPSSINVRTTQGHSKEQQYDVEDTAIINFDYQQKFVSSHEKVVGTFTITRSGYKQDERITVRGTQGSIELKRNGIRRFDREGRIIASLMRDSDIVGDPLVKMVGHFSDVVAGKTLHLIDDYREHFMHANVIDAAYRSDQCLQTIQIAPALPSQHYTWPIITHRTQQAVIAQLNTDISIYDRSGVIKEFEDKFAAYHERKFALSTNSGTSALFGMYEGLNLTSGDEVIVPAYTFFATISPLIYLSATPIFCDCLPDGNIDPKEIAKKITSKTKAIVITHMWGLPCNMDEIVSISNHYNVPLLEDCSHAHGATYKGKKVGTFGTAAVWSLQGQKIITGGEGGILLTDNYDIFSRATLQGQYNRRAKQTLDPKDPLYKFSLTGFGLKLRAHPMGIAIANEQFDHLDGWLKQKSLHANYIIRSLSDVAFLVPPDTHCKNPAWYALVFQYKEDIAGYPVELFIKALHSIGLSCVEQPKSTQPAYNLALFTYPSQAMPRLYSRDLINNERYPNADKFYQQAIKLPVWASGEDKAIVDRYILGIREIAQHVIEKTLNDYLGQARAKL